MAAFNSPDDSGRHTQVLLLMQHSFEMLLKAALAQVGASRVSIFDRRTGRSIGFEKCIEISRGLDGIRLTESEVGVLRAIDAMRDDEQHWFNQVSEQILYLQARLAVTAFDDILRRVFEESLADHLPVRVLPLSSDPPESIDILLDSEYRTIFDLLRPGRRMTHEARARIRTFLALESYAGEESKVSKMDVDRVQSAIRGGAAISDVFPKLRTLRTEISGTGAQLVVRISKNEGAPVRYVSDAATPAAAIREVDLQRKFHVGPLELASSLGLSGPRCVALRRHTGIDQNQKVSHSFKFGSQTHLRFSDYAVVLLRKAMQELDMQKIWRSHAPGSKNTPLCTQPQCAAPQ
ncbi:hypothetical protein IR132_08445 [Micrococcus yunnanensis]|nr:hypothetical protein [Micrococcus yunnanensis]TFU54357.1 hypothetical protein E4T95_08430 [Micrococcus yunnanensis]